MSIIVAESVPYQIALDRATVTALDRIPTLDGHALGIARLVRVRTRNGVRRFTFAVVLMGDIFDDRG